MRFHSRPAESGPLFVSCCLGFVYCGPCRPGARKNPRMRVDDYQIDAELLPQNHKLTARAVVKITALEDI